MSKTAVVLLNLGGPDSIESIEPFLFNLFRDPDIFKIPIGQKLFAKIISKRRAPKVAEEYELIGGKSPINEWTEIQRKMLDIELKSYDPNIDVLVAMRYWKPLTEETIECINKNDYNKIYLLPLYPQFSVSTTGSSFNEWKRKFNGDENKVVYINNYHDDLTYVKAINERIDQTLLRFPEDIRKDVQLVFSAHGTPMSMVRNGDPYSGQIKKSIELIMKDRNYSHEHHLCYQSKVGPVKWLEPGTDDKIEELAKEGKKHLLIIPISFVSDHVETSFELDIEYRHVADENNIENYIVMTGLNDSKTFIKALKDITIKEIERNKN